MPGSMLIIAIIIVIIIVIITIIVIIIILIIVIVIIIIIIIIIIIVSNKGCFSGLVKQTSCSRRMMSFIDEACMICTKSITTSYFLRWGSDHGAEGAVHIRFPRGGICRS